MSIRVRLLANKMTRAVNENVDCILKVSTGYTIDDAGQQIPDYVEQNVELQLQSMSTQELAHFDFINQQGQFVYGYANGVISAIRRQLDKPSSVAIFAAYGEESTSEWNVKQVVESYNDWVKVVLWRLN